MSLHPLVQARVPTRSLPGHETSRKERYKIWEEPTDPTRLSRSTRPTGHGPARHTQYQRSSDKEFVKRLLSPVGLDGRTVCTQTGPGQREETPQETGDESHTPVRLRDSSRSCIRIRSSLRTTNLTRATVRVIKKTP